MAVDKPQQAHKEQLALAAVPPGSDFYYASLYFPPATRNALGALHALRQEITRIPESCSDRGVAHIKLAWWREELNALEGGTARHGLSQALCPLLKTNRDILPMFRQYVERVDDSLVPRAFADRSDVQDYLIELLRPWLSCMAKIADPCHDGVTDPIHPGLCRLVAMSELSYELRALRRHRRRATLYLSTVALARHKLTVDGVQQAHESKLIKGLMHEELSHLRSDLQQTLAAMPKALRRSQRHFTTIARIQIAALRLALDDDCQLLERRQELTPVHKLAIAWRCRWLP